MSLVSVFGEIVSLQPGGNERKQSDAFRKNIQESSLSWRTLKCQSLRCLLRQTLKTNQPATATVVSPNNPTLSCF